jgi:acetyl esterase/lipase
LKDAAAAVAWTIRNLQKYGGSADRLFLAGHSAGGYLACMLALDKGWLAAHGMEADSLAGVIPLSPQAITHFAVRKESGIGELQPIIDRFAPLFHVRKDASPMLLVTGDREKELYGRYEENAYLWRMLKLVKHPDVTLHELQGYDHGQMAEPSMPLLLRFVESRGKPRQAAGTGAK